MRKVLIIPVFLMALFAMALPAAAQAQIGISVSFGPPALPVYEQPFCPGDGYLWTPGYWAYDEDDYYWVPGTWVLAPEPGLFWTPAYWAWGGDGFRFYDGYWGPQVGFYGGINYGFGYFGDGYEGGRWDHDRFFYNRSVNNVNVTNIHNVYNTTVINNTNVTRVSYNGGNGGINARPTAAQEAVAHERHIAPVAAQAEHIQAARSNPELRASANQGKPPIAATPRPGALRDREVIPAKAAGGAYTPQPNHGSARAQGQPAANPPAAKPENGNSRPGQIIHPNDIPKAERTPFQPSGNEKVDRKYQQQQERMQAKQDQDRQRLQQKQDQEHQRMAQRNADEARKQQVEQRHQQQTQQLQQKHEVQQQHLQQRAPQPRPNQPGPGL